MKAIAIIGCGGFGREVLQLIKQINLVSPTWRILGFFDDTFTSKCQQAEVHGYPILGSIADIGRKFSDISLVFAIGNREVYKRIFLDVDQRSFNFPNIVHPSVSIDEETCHIGIGNIICKDSTLTCDIRIGNFNVFNINVIVGHDVTIGDFNIFGPRVQISGGVTIGDENQWGLSSGIIQNRSVGNGNYIGGFSFIVRNITDNKSYFGVPAVLQKY